MRLWAVVLLLLAFNGIPSIVVAQTKDTIVHSDSAVLNEVAVPPPEDDEFNLFLQLLLFVAFALIIGIGAAGALASILAAVAITALAAAGVFSVALAAGLYKRSVKAGIRALIYILCAVGGAGCGIAALWLGRVMINQHFSAAFILGIGAIFGAAGGWLAAWSGLRLFSFILRRFLNR